MITACSFLLLCLSGFLDKNNDLLFRNLKEASPRLFPVAGFEEVCCGFNEKCVVCVLAGYVYVREQDPDAVF